MKEYLVDVPVKVNIWIRPECQKAQFEVLKMARPSILFIQSDGGRNEKEWEAIRKNRELFDNEIDWECTVYKVYENVNNGLYAMGKKVSELIWSKVDRCIFLEDDDIPSVSFFRYCAELLEKYKDDTRVCRICGMNHIGVSSNVTSDYFFSNEGSIWGVATWKRVVELRDESFDYGNDDYIFNLLKKKCKKDKFFKKKLIGYTKDRLFEGHIAGAEFFQSFNTYAHNMLQIIPKYNMICNIGATYNSAHSDEFNLIPKSGKRLFNMKTYEYDFPLKHPKYMICDDKYAEQVDNILMHNKPIKAFFRRIESFYLVIKYKGLKGLFKKIKHFIYKKKKIEN